MRNAKRETRTDHKAPHALKTIGEVAECLKLPPHVLRFWEEKFTQLRPVKRGGARRYYSPDDIRLLRLIRCCLREQGYTIRGVKLLLKKHGVNGLAAILEETTPDLDQTATPPPSRSQPSPTGPPTTMKKATPKNDKDAFKIGGVVADLRDVVTELTALRGRLHGNVDKI